MTKEMAISILRGAVLETDEQTHEAVYMAIRALKEQERGEKMADRLISADKLIESINRQIDKAIANKELKEMMRQALLQEIADTPTVEPKHGHWDNKIIDARFDVPHTVARCSNCKGKIWVYAENYVVKYPYCPLCGCKMDEVTE